MRFIRAGWPFASGIDENSENFTVMKPSIGIGAVNGLLLRPGPEGTARLTAGPACATRPSWRTLRGTLRSLRRRRWTLGEEWSHGDDRPEGE
jgi:hypothetical protein